jgi:hypothetical protein
MPASAVGGRSANGEPSPPRRCTGNSGGRPGAVGDNGLSRRRCTMGRAADGVPLVGPAAAGAASGGRMGSSETSGASGSERGRGAGGLASGADSGGAASWGSAGVGSTVDVGADVGVGSGVRAGVRTGSAERVCDPAADGDRSGSVRVSDPGTTRDSTGWRDR